MRERPILFSGEMVRAILEGRKTQTRRVVKNPNGYADDENWPIWSDEYGDWHRQGCPYGKPGDRLWVRETWHYHDWTDEGVPWIGYRADDSSEYRGDSFLEHGNSEWGEKVSEIWAELSDPENFEKHGAARDNRWRPSIHMPRWASRINLEIVNVRVERLKDISDSDILSEGIVRPDLVKGDVWNPIGTWRQLWTSINGEESWNANPWVWVVEFNLEGAVS